MELKRNGLLPLNLQFFAEAGGDGAGGEAAPAGDGAGAGAGGETPPAGDAKSEGGGEDLAAKIKQMEADMAKQKAALDKATSEAAQYKKELRTKQTQEEIDLAN